MKGDWESWVKFFLRAIKESSDLSNLTAISIFKLQKKDREIILLNKPTSFTVEVFNEFCRNPIQNSANLMKIMKAPTKPKIQRSLNHLQEVGILKEISGKQRNKKYVYDQYLNLLV